MSERFPPGGMMIEIVAKTLIYDGTLQPPDRRIAYFTSLCPLRSGTILSAFQVGPGKHHPDSTTGLCRSRDGGMTWEDISPVWPTILDGAPGSLSGGEMVEAEPGRVLLFTTWFDRSDRARPLFDPVTEGLLRSRQLIAESLDEGQTWSHWRILETPELKGCALTGPVLRWGASSIAFPFESFKEFDDPEPARHAAWLLVSHDNGRTFLPPLQVAKHPLDELYYWDQRLSPTSESGDFVALFWTHDRVSKRDRTVHLRRGAVREGKIELGEIIATTIPGQIAAPLQLPDGRLLAFVVDRDKPGTMTLWTSRDAGVSWPVEESLVIHTHDERAKLSQGKENIDFAQYWEDMGKWTFGHPAARLLPDGTVLLAYYAGDPQAMSLHAVHVKID
ncbi:MAG: sialidase family protein [Planctomycetales bacterium]